MATAAAARLKKIWWIEQLRGEKLGLELETALTLTNCIEREKQRLADLRDAVARITAPLDGLPRSNNYTSRVESLIVLIAEAEENLRDLYDEKLVARLNLLSIIHRTTGLTPQMERLLELRYCRCLSFAAIAKEMGYSQRHTYKLHHEAKSRLLQQFDKIISSFAAGTSTLSATAE